MTNTEDLQKLLDDFPHYLIVHGEPNLLNEAIRDVNAWHKKFEESFSAFLKDYDKQIHVPRKQLSDLIDTIPIDLQKVGRKYECYSIGTKKQWIEWFARYNLILQPKELLGESEKEEPEHIVERLEREELGRKYAHLRVKKGEGGV